MRLTAKGSNRFSSSTMSLNKIVVPIWILLEACPAVCEVVSDESVVEGAQRIGGLWR